MHIVSTQSGETMTIDGPVGNQPIVYQGSIVSDKKRDILTLDTGNNQILLRAELVTHQNFVERLFTHAKKFEYYDTQLRAKKTVYLKVDTATSEVFSEKGEKALQSAEKHMRDSLVQDARKATLQKKEDLPVPPPRGVRPPSPPPRNVNVPSPPPRSASPPLSQERRIEQKMAQLKDIEMRISFSFFSKVKNQEKIRKNAIPLSENLKRELVTCIEMHKDTWLAEAAKNKSWIRRKVRLSNKMEVKVEIFPPDRKNKDKLGLIDVRMEFVNKGSFKKTYKSLNYDVGKVTAGVYGVTEKIKEDLAAESRLEDGLEELQKANPTEKIKKKVVVSKSQDSRIKTTKKNEKIEKSKLSQTLYGRVDLFDVLLDGKLPNGKLIDEKTRIQLMISAFESLEQLHEMGLVHADIKLENMLLKEKTDPQTGQKYYVVRIIDYGFIVDADKKHILRGTPGYIAPELILETDKEIQMGKGEKSSCTYTVASDIYAMGVGFADVGNADPWWAEAEANPDLDLISGILNSPTFMNASIGVNYPRLGKGLYSPKFQAGLNKMTSFYPSERFQSATEAKLYFQGLLKSM